MNIYHLCGGVIAVILLLYVYDNYRVKRNWIKGICPYTGEPWEYVGYDARVGVHLYKTQTGQSIVFDRKM
jgi:hypothetical protein